MAYGQYRFWRIRFITTQGAVTPRIARIRFYGNSGAADDWTIPTIGVSDTGKADANSNNAADTSTATNWITGQSAVTDAWVGARIYGGPAQIKEIGITATNDVNFAGAPSAFWVEGSNDDDTVAVPANWVRLAYVGAATWTQGSTQTFAYTVVSPTDTAKISRVAADVAYSAARTAKLSAVETEVLQKPSGVNTRLSAVPTQVLITNINSPSTSAALLTATTSIISGVVHINGIATSSTTDSVTYSGDPVTYNGDPVIIGMAGTATTSLIPGVGSASNPGDASATGATVTATCSLIPGAGAALNGANGATLVTTCSLIPGTATGVWNLGQTLVVGQSVFLAGNGSGTANASGGLVTETFTIIPGGETGTASIGGSLVTMGYSLIAGAATGQKNAAVSGVTLTETCTLIAGLVTTTANVQGQMLVETETFIPGGAVINSTARGNILPFTPSILRGSVTVDTEVLGKVIHVDFSLPENTLGVVTGGANTPADVVPFSYLVELEGTATGTAVARGAVVSFAALVLDGAVSADANIDAGTIFNVSVTLEPGVGFWFIGSPGDVMVDPHSDTRMELLAEMRTFTVSVETRAIIVPHEERAMALSPRLKKVI
jgi:hypothetical protein